MPLFRCESFRSHSGLSLDFKIDCDALSNRDIACLARIIAKRQEFRHVHGIPRGGTRLAEVLREYSDPDSTNVLIVDDVLTTGRSMEEAKRKYEPTGLSIVGWVIFARGRLPNWIYAVFELNEVLR